MSTTIETPTKTFPRLYKTTSGGKLQIWDVAVTPNGDGTATINITIGQLGGKLRTTPEHITAGTNVGRANERNPVEQAYAEAESRWTEKQQRSHYSTDSSGRESAVKRAEAPMLAESYWRLDKVTNTFVRTTHAGKVDWATAYAQPKLDGNRCLGTAAGRLTSREGVDITAALPHISKAVADLKLPPGSVLDGEIYQHGLPVTSLSGLITGGHPDALKLEYHVYDQVSAATFSVRSPAVLIAGAPLPLRAVETVCVNSEAELEAFQKKAIAAGYEGAMLRWGTAGYEGGKRSKHLLKVKTFVDEEFRVVAIKEGRATYAGMAIFTCVTKNCDLFDVTAPGDHDAKRAFYRDRADYIGMKLTVKFSGYTRTDKPVPFHPVALQFRDNL